VSAATLATPERPAREFRQATRVVSALAYHKVAPIPDAARHRCNYVTPARFDLQLRAMRAAGYQSISFADYLAHRRGERSVPPRAVIFSFDDGYRSTLDSAVPILQRHGFSATFFVVAGLLGGTNTWDQGELQEPLLSAQDVRKLDRLGFEIGSHTLTHAHLTELSPAEVRHELAESKRILEEIVSKPVSTLAYPWSEHSPAVHEAAHDAGYEMAAILRRRTNYDSTPLLQLRRIGVNDDTTLARFAWDLARLRFRGS
jgi:peptidoglycan/xylan/chitin deacetylase (PgdA/CDA1 family)